MPAAAPPSATRARLDALRAEFADLAFELERQGRRDAADVVMMLDRRLDVVAGEIAAHGEQWLAQPASTRNFP